ncbi:hypothetical protein JQC92_01555 [Shewanella sp. 202IG2-18]|uniref:hypothetical protein n=1 Tax=Parashewanella hymeniacidonis TaxID=2807618 RepID=UPI001961E238|nr:hypothetical protein [Parashewanella hymeniacidonis]MBM7070729.1 hypothetical protein [Parashewanella hymeniacidonis]
MNRSVINHLISISLVLCLTHCASAPKLMHCKDDGKGLKPINTQAVKLDSTKKNNKENHD